MISQYFHLKRFCLKKKIYVIEQIPTHFRIISTYLNRDLDGSKKTSDKSIDYKDVWDEKLIKNRLFFNFIQKIP